jgi:hypothetical protein
MEEFYNHRNHKDTEVRRTRYIETQLGGKFCVEGGYVAGFDSHGCEAVLFRVKIDNQEGEYSFPVYAQDVGVSGLVLKPHHEKLLGPKHKETNNGSWKGADFTFGPVDPSMLIYVLLLERVLTRNSFR